MNVAIGIIQQQGYAENEPAPPVNGGSAPEQYTPTVYMDAGTVGGVYTKMPKGCILHGSRSGQPAYDTHYEFDVTRRYAASGIDLGWTITVGDDEISIHMKANQWGWNARACSDDYLACEFAQSVNTKPISDAQVRAFAWYIRAYALLMWPDMPMDFPTHAELDKSGATGTFDGKDDVFPYGDARTEDLRARIMARLVDPSWCV